MAFEDEDEGQQEEPEAGPEGERPAENAGEVARETLARILALMGLEAEVALEPQPDDSFRLEVTGEETDVVVGRHGSTINALQYLVGLIAHNRLGERVRVVIDAGGYRAQREETLIELARSYAQQVRETGQEAVLDALHSYERRIIHTALADDPDVTTYSEGEEPERRVVITPRDAE
jgi:spoIIIJ-associated protein